MSDRQQTSDEWEWTKQNLGNPKMTDDDAMIGQAREVKGRVTSGALSREQVEQMKKDGFVPDIYRVLDSHESLRATLAQQAQEVETLNELLRRDGLAQGEIDSLASDLQDLKQEIESWKRTANAYEQAHQVCNGQLAAMAAERDEAVESTYVPGSWSCPVCQFAQVNSVLCATSGRVGADTESVPLCPNDGTLMKRETWKGYAVAYEKSLVEKLQQLAASQARVREALRFYADPHTYELNGGTNERIIKDHGQQAQRALKEV